jgi:two-component system sensor histidine kinase/response regulator
VLPRTDAKTVPIIAMTADVFADAVQKCLQVGMNAHLAKPINPQELYKVVKQFLPSPKPSAVLKS